MRDARGFREACRELIFLAKMTRAGLEETLTAGLMLSGGLGRGDLGLLQVIEVCRAVPASDFIDMKANVVGFVIIKHAEKVLPQGVTIGARQSSPAPDDAHAMETSVLASDDRS